MSAVKSQLTDSLHGQPLGRFVSAGDMQKRADVSLIFSYFARVVLSEVMLE